MSTASAQTTESPDTAAPAASAVKVQVREFKISGSKLLPDEKLQAVVAPYKGERSLDELKAAAQAVQDAYRNAGYGAVIAYLPEQTGAAPGEVTIAVLEGRIERVVVSGNKQYTEANIRRSLPLIKEGETPQVQKIDAQIQLANENPGKQVAVSLEPGANQGEVNVNISVQEQPASRVTVAVDNTGNDNTGRWRTSLSYSNAALWDLDHSVTLQFQTAPENPSRVQVYSANYRIPFYGFGSTLDLFAAHSSVDGGNTATAAGPLQFSGKGNVFGARLTDYLVRLGEVDQRLIFGLDQREYLNNCAITGLPDGACGTAGASVAVHPVSIEYTAQRGGERAMGMNIALSHNLPVGGSHAGEDDYEAVRAGAKRSYTTLRLGAFGSLPLGANGMQLQARFNAQATGDALVPGEQFGLGGATTVRGYEEREVVGDSGFVGSVELYSPDFAARFGERVKSARVLAFIDGGHVSNRKGLPCLGNATSCWLGSVGIGFQLSTGPLSLRVDLANARRDAVTTRRNDYFTHFSASYSFI